MTKKKLCKTFKEKNAGREKKRIFHRHSKFVQFVYKIFENPNIIEVISTVKIFAHPRSSNTFQNVQEYDFQPNDQCWIFKEAAKRYAVSLETTGQKTSVEVDQKGKRTSKKKGKAANDGKQKNGLFKR